MSPRPFAIRPGRPRQVFLSQPADTLEPRIRHLKNYQLIEKPCQFELLIGAVGHI